MRRIIALLLLAAAVAAAERVETNADGSTTRAKVDAHGRRQGESTTWFPAKGVKKPVREKAVYRDDRLHGPRQVYDEAGHVVSDEAWVDGVLVFPKSQTQIDATLARIPALAKDVVATLKEGWHGDAPKPDAMAALLAETMVDRYLCDVPWDLRLSVNYIACAQEAAALMAKLGRLEWDPKKPDGMGDDQFRLAYLGCHHTNAAQAQDGMDALRQWMFDSGAGEINRCPRRRCLLNPAIRDVGFGASGGFHTLYVGDESRQDVPDYDVVCFPPRGFCPVDRFPAGTAWHASVNPAHYDLVGPETTMDFQPVDAELKPVGAALELENRNVSLDAFGIPGAVIERPKDFTPTKGATVRVTLGHLKPRDARPDTLTWYVAFY